VSASKQYSPKAAPQPASIPARYAAVPRELIERRQWVAWQFEWKPGEDKPRKVLINPKTGGHASHSIPATWGTFKAAIARMEKDSLPGIGFVFSADDPYFGADFDHCRNVETGEISAEVRAIVSRFDTYAEISPSATGLKLIGKGTMSGKGSGRNDRAKGYEAYSRQRFFTITGDHLAGSPLTIEPRQEVLNWHIATNFKPKPPKADKLPPSETREDDQVVIAQALGAKNGKKFGQLYAGAQLNYASDSEADQAFCNILAY
jgi:putative DNA primase/helicase